jgi:uncharacterized membrane protein
MSLLADVHFAVGSGSVLSDFLAMGLKEGSALHRHTGRLFAASMVLLCLSGFYLSYGRELQFAFLLSALSLYLVLTGWWAARRNDKHAGL